MAILNTSLMRGFLMSFFMIVLLTIPASASDSVKTVHEGEGLMVRAACETEEQLNVFVAMLTDGSNVSQAKIYLWSNCPIFSSPQNAIITEVLQTLDAHQRRWFIVRLFVIQKGREYYSFWSTPLNQRDA